MGASGNYRRPPYHQPELPIDPPEDAAATRRAERLASLWEDVYDLASGGIDEAHEGGTELMPVRVRRVRELLDKIEQEAA